MSLWPLSVFRRPPLINDTSSSPCKIYLQPSIFAALPMWSIPIIGITYCRTGRRRSENTLRDISDTRAIKHFSNRGRCCGSLVLWHSDTRPWSIAEDGRRSWRITSHKTSTNVDDFIDFSCTRFAPKPSENKQSQTMEYMTTKDRRKIRGRWEGGWADWRTDGRTDGWKDNIPSYII